MDEDKGERREKDQESRNQKRNQIVSPLDSGEKEKRNQIVDGNQVQICGDGGENKAKKRHKRDRAGPRGCGRQKVSDTQR